MSGTGTRQISHRFGNFSICSMLLGLQLSPFDRVASLQQNSPQKLDISCIFLITTSNSS